MADIINLRRRRKQQERSAKERIAKENRVRFGLGKGAKARLHFDRQRPEKELSGKRLDVDQKPRDRD